jgi:hypothetical protein
MSTAEGKKRHNIAQRRYMQTDKGKKYRLDYGREYEKTEKCISYRKSLEYQNILTEWRKTHSEYKHNQDKIYRDKRRLENPEEIRFYFREYFRTRSKIDVNFKITYVLRHRIRVAITQGDGKRHCKSTELLGCNIPFVRNYIESLFLEGMDWGNYGYGKNKWNIDHIVPCAAFNLLDPQEQKKCFHYTNLQPLWQHDNFTKGSKHNGKSYRKKVSK